MSKKNLPNIPIYIGDWERDCNVLSLESEAAWMRIVFKLWTKGKQNTIKIPAKSLQNLWRCSEEKMKEIVADLTYNEICEINVDGQFIEFTCRRFVKENKLSEVRSEAAKGNSKPNKKEAKDKQTASKSEQNTDNENENENVIKTENENKKEKAKFKNSDFPKILIQLGADETQVKDWMKARKNKKAVNSETALRKFLNECENYNFPVADAVKICAENSWSGFKYEWVENLNNNQNGNRSNTNTRTDAQLKADASDAVDRMLGTK